MKVGRQIIGETKKRQKLFGEADQGKRQKLFCGADREKAAGGSADAGTPLQGMGLRTKLRISIRLNYPGMARRVLLLTALMWQPRLIIADEPTPGMDLALAKQAMGFPDICGRWKRCASDYT